MDDKISNDLAKKARLLHYIVFFSSIALLAAIYFKQDPFMARVAEQAAAVRRITNNEIASRINVESREKHVSGYYIVRSTKYSFNESVSNERKASIISRNAATGDRIYLQIFAPTAFFDKKWSADSSVCATKYTELNIPTHGAFAYLRENWSKFSDLTVLDKLSLSETHTLTIQRSWGEQLVEIDMIGLNNRKKCQYKRGCPGDIPNWSIYGHYCNGHIGATWGRSRLPDDMYIDAYDEAEHTISLDFSISEFGRERKIDLIKVIGDISGIQDLAVNGFEKTFRDLASFMARMKYIDVRDIEAISSDMVANHSKKVKLAELDIPLNDVLSFGPIIIFSITINIFITLTVMVNSGGRYATPWIGLYPGALPHAIAILTMIIIPVAASIYTTVGLTDFLYFSFAHSLRGYILLISALGDVLMILMAWKITQLLAAIRRNSAYLPREE